MTKFFKRKGIHISINKLYYPFIRFFLKLNGETIGLMTIEDKKNGSLLLGDIEPFSDIKYINRGYGSMMLEELFKYASKKKGVNQIYGHLSVVDADHKDRLLHFYEKHGFTITLYDEMQGCFFGEIEKQAPFI